VQPIITDTSFQSSGNLFILDKGTRDMDSLYIWAPLAALLFTSITTIGGIGGAFVLVPIFYSLGLPMYEAETLGLLLAFFSAGAASINYHHGKHIKYKMASALIACALVFSPIGSYVSAVVNRNIVFFAFILLLAAGGSIMLFYHPKGEAGSDRAENSKADYMLAILAGGLIGFISGFLGIGGGILVGPFLILRGFMAKDVSGTSSLFVVSSGFIGFLSHLDFMGYAHVRVNYPLFGLVIAGAVIGGVVGSYLARFKLSAVQIRIIIGTLQYIMAVRIILDLKM
jgi:uncharacterized membrane protein YfcA